jgi:hypothetical protein
LILRWLALDKLDVEVGKEEGRQLQVHRKHSGNELKVDAEGQVGCTGLHHCEFYSKRDSFPHSFSPIKNPRGVDVRCSTINSSYISSLFPVTNFPIRDLVLLLPNIP